MTKRSGISSNLQNSFALTVLFLCLTGNVGSVYGQEKPLQANAPKAGEPAAYIINAKRAFALSIEANGELTIPNGALNVFSTNPAAIRLRDLGAVHAKTIAQAPNGGVLKDGKAIAPGQGILPAIADPWANSALPDLSGLKNFGDVELQTERVTLQPGVYDSLVVGSLSQAQLAPGVYVFKNRVEIASKNGVQGQNVTIINHGQFLLNGSGTVRLTAPTTGPLAGIVFWQERTNKKSVQIEGNATMEVMGALYLPTAYLQVVANGKVACTHLVADSLRLSANGKLVVR